MLCAAQQGAASDVSIAAAGQKPSMLDTSDSIAAFSQDAQCSPWQTHHNCTHDTPHNFLPAAACCYLVHFIEPLLFALIEARVMSPKRSSHPSSLLLLLLLCSPATAHVDWGCSSGAANDAAVCLSDGLPYSVVRW
jgi:hypothetical protein